MNDCVKGLIVVEPFLVHSSSSNSYILYLIAVDINRQTRGFLTRTKSYDEVGRLDTCVHNNAFLAISYTASRGTGVKLPIIEAVYDKVPQYDPTANVVVDTVSRIHDETTVGDNNDDEESNSDDSYLNDDSFTMYNHIVRVSEKIMSLLDDRTVKTQVLNIAQYLLKCKKMSVSDIVRQLDKPGAKAILEKLLDCSSDLLSSDPRALGVDISNHIVSERIQKSLDIKSIQAKNNTMMPKIKHSILHSHPTSIWIRFYSTCLNILDARLLENNNYHIITLCKNVYELYIYKSVYEIDIATTNILCKTLERYYDADIIFCSELQYFSYNKLLFISNYVKFMWCYLLDKQIFNPTTASDFKTISIYMMHSLLFLRSSNLAHMSTSTHNPLIAYTGERPRTAMNKFDTRRVYRVEGNRAMMTVGKSGDFGSRSNFVEIVSKIELDHSVLADII